ncbi:MAG: class C sortase, partial [Clostridium sp.]
MKKNISTIIIFLLFFGGLIVFLYPTISNFYNEKAGSYAVSGYNKDVVAYTDDSLSNILNKAEEYNGGLWENGTSFINGSPIDENYKSQLKLGNNDIMGYIEIEKINVRLPIYHGTSNGVLQSGVGHLEGSALPIGGVNNHTVLSGHTGLPSAKLLTNLNKLKIGDKIVIKVLKNTLTYTVLDINTVLPSETELLKPQVGRDLLTLFTCTPYGVNSHRLLVTAERVENVEEVDIEEKHTRVTEKVKDILKDNGVFIIIFAFIMIT